MKGLQLVQLNLWDKIKALDYKIFSKINIDWHSSFFDAVCPFLREKELWVPFYVFLLIFATVNFKKRGWYWVLFLIITASLSDIISSSVVKPNFFRLRPCNDSLLANVRLLTNHCPVNSSFTSSHATNHFAVAMFIFSTFKNAVSKWWGILFIWAFMVSFSQVYVGIHFPLDVICGGILGLIIGYLPGKIFNQKIGLRPELK